MNEAIVPIDCKRNVNNLMIKSTNTVIINYPPRKKIGNNVMLSSVIPNKINCLNGSGAKNEIINKTIVMMIDNNFFSF